MELSPILLSKLLFYSFIWGMVLGALNDISRIIRVFLGVRYSDKAAGCIRSLLKLPKEKNKIKKGKRVLLDMAIFFQDLFLMIVGACGIVVLGYYLNDGEIRLFVPFSVGVGAIFWYMSFGKIVIAFSEPIVVIIKYVIHRFFWLLWLPVHFFGIFISRICEKFFVQVKKAIANKRNMRYNKKREEYYTKLSRFGFVSKEVLKG